MITKYLLMLILVFSASLNAEEIAPNQKSQAVWELFSASLNVSSWNYSSLNDGLEIDWSTQLQLLNKDDYEFDFNFTSHYDKQTDDFSDVTVREEERSATLNFDVNRIWNKLGISSYNEIRQQKINQIYDVKYDGSLSIGLKYDIYESEKIKELSFSYLPIYNYSEYYYISMNTDGTEALEKYIQRSIQHGFRLNISLAFLKKRLGVSNETWWKEVKPLDEINANTRNFQFINTLKLQYHPNTHLSLGYNNTIEVDENRRERQNRPSTDHRHTMTFGLHWN